MGECGKSASGISTRTKKTINGLSLVVHVFNLALGRRRQEDLCEFKDRQSYIVRLCIERKQNKKLPQAQESTDVGGEHGKEASAPSSWMELCWNQWICSPGRELTEHLDRNL